MGISLAGKGRCAGIIGHHRALPLINGGLARYATLKNLLKKAGNFKLLNYMFLVRIIRQVEKQDKACCLADCDVEEGFKS
ncbi:hypothetical protein [Pantoea sp. SGAir0175]